MEKETTTDEYPEPAAELVVKDLETLKVISDPLRLQILELMLGGPCTVKQLAKELNTTTTKLYYHINLLEQHGLIRVVNTRVVSGIIEKQYHVTAYSVRPDKSLLSPASGAVFEEGLPMLVSNVFEHTANDINRSIKAGLISTADADRQHRTFMLLRTVSQMSKDQLATFYSRLEELLKEFNAVCTDEPDDKVYGLMVALYPAHNVRIPPKAKAKEKDSE
jgi:DNA-binding transcriptional ArsR family regulator